MAWQIAELTASLQRMENIFSGWGLMQNIAFKAANLETVSASFIRMFPIYEGNFSKWILERSRLLFTSDFPMVNTPKWASSFEPMPRPLLSFDSIGLIQLCFCYFFVVFIFLSTDLCGIFSFGICPARQFNFLFPLANTSSILCFKEKRCTWFVMRHILSIAFDLGVYLLSYLRG